MDRLPRPLKGAGRGPLPTHRRGSRGPRYDGLYVIWAPGELRSIPMNEAQLSERPGSLFSRKAGGVARGHNEVCTAHAQRDADRSVHRAETRRSRIGRNPGPSISTDRAERITQPQESLVMLRTPAAWRRGIRRSSGERRPSGQPSQIALLISAASATRSGQLVKAARERRTGNAGYRPALSTP